MTHDSKGASSEVTEDETTVMTYGYSLAEARYLIAVIEQVGGVRVFRSMYGAGAIREPGFLERLPMRCSHGWMKGFGHE